MEVSRLTEKIKEFNEAREWSSYHDLRSVTLALASEVGEIATLLRWKKGKTKLSKKTMKQIESEIADVYIFLTILSYQLNINMESCVIDKLKINDKRFPVEDKVGFEDERE